MTNARLGTSLAYLCLLCSTSSQDFVFWNSINQKGFKKKKKHRFALPARQTTTAARVSRLLDCGTCVTPHIKLWVALL
ncbi:hypothetical protein V8C40DRAFT_237143 [Trichoderma camerunense]